MVGDSDSTLPSACVGEDSRSLPALGQWKKEQIKYKSRGEKSETKYRHEYGADSRLEPLNQNIKNTHILSSSDLIRSRPHAEKKV